MKTKWKAGTLLAPLPSTLVTVKDGDKTNILTVAWSGILSSVPPMTYISVRPERYSYQLLKNSGEFVINVPTAQLARAADLCGMKSGKECDKFALCNLTAEQPTELTTQMIAECPVSLECKINRVIPLGSHDMFIADIVAVNVDTQLIDEKGKLRLDKCSLLAFAHGEYYSLGKRINSFGFSVRKKASKNKRG